MNVNGTLKTTFWCFVTPAGVQPPTNINGTKKPYCSKTYTFVVGVVQTPTDKYKFEHQFGFIQCPPNSSLRFGQAVACLHQNKFACFEVWPLDFSIQTKQAFGNFCFTKLEPEYKKTRIEEIIERRDKRRQHWENKNYPNAQLRSLFKPGSLVKIVDKNDPTAAKEKETKKIATKSFTEKHFSVSNVANHMADAAAKWNQHNEMEKQETLQFYQWCLEKYGLKGMNRSTLAYLACSLPPFLSDDESE